MVSFIPRAKSFLNILFYDRKATHQMDLRRIKIGSHAQTALTLEQRKSRAKTKRRNARFAYTEILRANGYKGPNISRSKLIKRMVSRGPSVQNTPRSQGETRGSVPSVSAPVET